MNSPMKGMPLQSTKTLLTLASARRAGRINLISIEHSYQASKSWRDTPTEKTLWHFWSCGQPEGGFSQPSESVVAIPPASAVSVAFGEDELLSLIESNQQHAAFLGSWKAAGTAVPEIAETGSALSPIDLSPTVEQQVQLDVREEWSTINLRPSGWLFNPSLTLLPDGVAIAAMNTADAHAVVWKLKGAEVPGEPFAFLQNALDPVPAVVGSKLMVFHRVPSPHWSVYFHTARYSEAFGPSALPLVMLELNKEGKMMGRSNLSKDDSIRDVFSFAAFANADRVVLATISGSKEQPILHLYSSVDLGKKFHEIGFAPLPMIPSHLSLGLGESSIVVGLTYKEASGYQVEGFCVPSSK